MSADPFSSLEFRWPWRAYQDRVLKTIEEHLHDKKLHIVAAPGSGKTILGLETFRRIGRPAVVLSPTRTIRNQWLQRLEGFLPEGSEMPPSWTSLDLKNPGILTSLTYRALHTSFRLEDERDEEEEVESDPGDAPSQGELREAVQQLRSANVGLVMMDEAHHLRQEWWKALTELISELNDAIVVSLTATPPYDVIGHEWQRYEALCGPIDEEISVPELVKSGTLCPHQDFVWAVLPAENDRSGIHDYDINVSEAISSLRQDKAFGDAISAHPWLAATEDESAGVFDDPEFTVAMLAYLHQRSQPLPKPILQMMDTKSKDLPALDRRWWQILVHRYLFDESWAPSEEREEHRDELAIRLRNLGLLWRHELRIEESRPVRAQLSITPSKIEACVQICQHERGHLEDRLRQVILTDFIRDRDDESHLLGACTVFRAVAMAQAQDALPKLALLTGRLVLIHESQVEAVRGATDDPIRLETRTADGVNGFVELTARGGSSPLVAALTRMLMQGDIHILVGTRALLGEGWDAPVVNSLVLASYVGSFMLSNQMRGRAIRKDPNDPNKASAIWHIVAVDPVTPAGMSDWEDMQRRFTTFVGLSTEKPVIESGLERLHIPRIDHEGDFDKVNTHAMDEAGKRGDLGQRWQEAIDRGELGIVVPCVRMPKPPRAPGFMFRNTLKYLLICAGQSWLLWWVNVMRSVRTDDFRTFAVVLAIGAAAAFLFTLPKLIEAAWLWLRCLPVDGSLKQMGLAVKEALEDADLFEMPGPRLSVDTAELDGGAYSVNLSGGNFRDKSIFADAMHELLGPIENPRYLLTREGSGLIGARKDYHAVPMLLGVKKERAGALQYAWKRRFGKCELIYTRSTEGRTRLLKARVRAFSGAFVGKSDRLDRWA